MNNRNQNQIKTIKLAGITNILFGICTTLIYLITFFSNTKIGGKTLLDMQGLLSNEIFKNMYMTFQLFIVILGIISAVYGFKLIKIKQSILFQVAYFLAGINCMLLMFMGVVLILAPINIVAGVKILALLKKEEDISDGDDEFGGRASALTDSNVSTATVMDSMMHKNDDENDMIENISEDNTDEDDTDEDNIDEDATDENNTDEE